MKFRVEKELAEKKKIGDALLEKSSLPEGKLVVRFFRILIRKQRRVCWQLRIIFTIDNSGLRMRLIFLFMTVVAIDSPI